MGRLRKIDFRDFDALLADADHLHTSGYDRGGKWDLAQILGHLTIYLRMSLDGFPVRLPRVVTGVLGRWVAKPFTLRTRWMPAKFPAPAAFVPPPGVDEAAAVAAFREAATRVRDHAGSFQPNPVFGKMSPAEWRQIHLIHAAHHLSFLRPREQQAVGRGQ